MERATVMKTFHGNLAPKSPILRERDASFSSYLQPHHHHHQHHAIASGRCSDLDDSTTELNIFDAHKYFNEVTNNDNNIQKVTTTITSINNSRVSPLLNNTTNMDMERIIPDQKGDIMSETTRYSSASSSGDGYGNIMRNYRGGSFHAATPTASSEASWNSQAGLLSQPAGAIQVSMMRNPPHPTDLNQKLRNSLSKPIWLLRRKCPCSGKKSVEVKEQKNTQMPQPQRDHDHLSLNLNRQDHDTPTPKNPENLKNIIPITPNGWVVTTTTNNNSNTINNKSQRFHSHRVVNSSVRDGFTFPVLNPHSSSTSISISSSSPMITNSKLHVPNGVVSEKEDPARDSLEVFQPPNDDTMELLPPSSVSPKSRVNVIMDEDTASDASSDLFEIESFTTTTATQSTCPATYRRRSDSIDEASSHFFFARGSMDEGPTTECYEPSEASIEWSVTTAAAEDQSGGGAVLGHGGEKWKRKGSSLVSCRCEKAVSVGPQPVKAVEGQRGTTTICSSRHVNVSVNKPPLSRPHNTPRMSLAFAT